MADRPALSSSAAMHIVKGEIHRVLSLLRNNARYSSSARFKEEVPAAAESAVFAAAATARAAAGRIRKSMVVLRYSGRCNLAERERVGQ